MPKRDLKPRVQFDGKGRVLIPKWIRDELNVKAEDIGEVEIYDNKILITLLGK